jgi:hypothetical protein
VVQVKFTSPNVALTVGVLASGAANVAWAASDGSARIAAGVFATVLVPVSLHLWPRVPITGPWTRAIRAVVMTVICGAAAVVNLTHAVRLLVAYGEEWWLSVLLVLAVEAVVVMASLARRQPVKSQAARAPRKVTPKVTPPTPAPVTVEESSEDRAKRLARERKARQRDRQRDPDVTREPLHSVGVS